MGRPLNKKYFGNRNIGSTTTAADDGIGGQAVASVPNATGLTGMTYLTGGPYTILAADISAPQLPGGVKPVLTFQPTSATAGTIQVVDGGSGYTSAPTVIVRGSLASGSGTTTKTAVLATDTGFVGSATNDENAIVVYAYHTGGSLLLGDINKQVSTDRYKVTNATGTAIAKLKGTIANAAGQMNIVATDTDGKTYYVIKLTSRKAVLVPAAVARLSTSAGTIFAPDSSGVYKSVPWKFDAATTGFVQIENV